MASIQRLTSKTTSEVSYRAQVRVKGHAAQSATFANRADAVKWSKSVEAAITEGRYFPQARASRTTFAEAVARYKDTAIADAKARSRQSRIQHLDYFLDRFAGLTLAQVTPDRVADARDELAAGTVKARSSRRASTRDPGRRSIATFQRSPICSRSRRRNGAWSIEIQCGKSQRSGNHAVGSGSFPTTSVSGC
jgi:hypothetical protein